MQQYQTRLHHNNEHNNVSRGADQSSCVSFVLVRSRMNHVDFSPTPQSEIAVSCQRTQHIPVHILTERGRDTKESGRNSDFQKYSSTYFIETAREVVSEVNLLFRHNRCRETSSRECCTCSLSYRALCILCALYCFCSNNHTCKNTALPPPHVSASAIFSPKKWQNPRLCLCCMYVYTLD